MLNNRHWGVGSLHHTSSEVFFDAKEWSKNGQHFVYSPSFELFDDQNAPVRD